MVNGCQPLPARHGLRASVWALTDRLPLLPDPGDQCAISRPSDSSPKWPSSWCSNAPSGACSSTSRWNPPHRAASPGPGPTPTRLIERFLDEVSVGDAIEAEGTFIQSDYVPYRTTCIDTTFFLLDYRRLSHPEQLIPAQAEVAAEALRRLRLH